LQWKITKNISGHGLVSRSSATRVTNALGCGQQKGYHESYRGADIEVNLLKKIRIEIAVNNDFVDSTIEAIIKGVTSGQSVIRFQR
jgi:nitrogen regulatory protein PII